jgi:hypothetical protein
MLHREITSVWCENHPKHINTQCEQNAKFYNGKVGGMYSNQFAL